MYADDLAYVHHTGFADLACGAARFLVDELAPSLSNPSHSVRVADLGCGSGLLARPLVDAGCEITCVDISPAMLSLAKRTVGRDRARFVQASLYDVRTWAPRNRAPFDAVLAVGEPLSSLGAGVHPLTRTFIDIARVLRPGGAFVFDVIVAGAPSLTRRAFVEGDGWTTCVSTLDEGTRLTRDITTFTRAGRTWQRGHETHVVRVLDVDDVKDALARAGFTVRVRKRYGAHPLAVRRRAFLCRLTR